MRDGGLGCEMIFFKKAKPRQRAALRILLVGVVLFVVGSIRFEERRELFRVGEFGASVPVARTFPMLRYLGLAGMLAGGAIWVANCRKR